MNRVASAIDTIFMAAALLLLSSSRSAQSQTNAEVDAGLQFHFSNPGARSLGLGGAFIGLADDATAAYTNPAGLILLSRPEVSAEGQRSGYTNQFTDRGHALGNPSGIGLDNVAGLVPGSSEVEINDLAFASFVYPQSQRHWAVAVYSSVLADFGASFKTQGAFVSSLRLLPTSNDLRLRIIGQGVSGALRLTDTLSIGGGLSEYHFDLSSLTNRYALNNFYGPPNYAPGRVAAFETQNGSDRDLAWNAGLLWKAGSWWRLGVVYRQGPSFRFQTTSQAGAFSGVPGAVFASNRASFHVPGLYGAGAAFQPTEAWTITVEYDRIRYSELTRDSVDIYDPIAMRNPSIKQLAAGDADEIHLGVEYVLTQLKRPLALRLGGWTDPDHKIRFSGAPAAGDTEAQFLSALFLRGNNEVHVSGGLGVVLSDQFEVNAAYDSSRFVSVASLSAVLRF